MIYCAIIKALQFFKINVIAWHVKKTNDVHGDHSCTWLQLSLSHKSTFQNYKTKLRVGNHLQICTMFAWNCPNLKESFFNFFFPWEGMILSYALPQRYAMSIMWQVFHVFLSRLLFGCHLLLKNLLATFARHCCAWECALVWFFLFKALHALYNMLQHIATRWPNMCNMLCPTMLWNVTCVWPASSQHDPTVTMLCLLRWNVASVWPGLKIWDHLVHRSEYNIKCIWSDICANWATSWEVSVTRIDWPNWITSPSIFKKR